MKSKYDLPIIDQHGDPRIIEAKYEDNVHYFISKMTLKESAGREKRYMEIGLYKNYTFPKIPKNVYYLMISGEIKDTHLRAIPETVKSLSLIYDYDFFTGFPKDLPKGLLHLSIRTNSSIPQEKSLKTFPDLGYFESLEELYISDILSWYYPITMPLSRLPKKIENLSLSGGNIPFIRELPKSLKYLYLFNTQTFRLPDDMKSLVNLEHIHVSAYKSGKSNEKAMQKLPELPTENLKSIKINYTDITELPPNISKMKKLKILDLRSNNIYGDIKTRLPKSLDILCLCDNNIISFKGLKSANLKWLDLSQNKIEEIESLSHMTKLEHLNLSMTKMKKFPKNLPKSLKIFLLYRTKIEHIPDISYLTKLKLLEVHWNPELKSFDNENLKNPRIKKKELFIAFLAEESGFGWFEYPGMFD